MKIISSKPNRVYVTNPLYWATAGGTDFLLTPSTTVSQVAATTVNGALVDEGWVLNSVSYATPTGADFMTSADKGTPNSFLFNASGDILRSPIIFGDWAHAYQASAILGYFPTSLNVEVVAAFTTNSADEGQTAFGLLEDGGTASVANDHLAAITTDAVTFILRSGAASDAGAAVDAAFHVFKIKLTSAGVQWFIDGTSQGSIALEADEFPVSFFAHTLTTNRISLGPTHIWYE